MRPPEAGSERTRPTNVTGSVRTRATNATAADALIDRVVTGARIASRTRREDLRRELQAHFEDACATPITVDAALRRFGPERTIVESLRRVYRLDFVLLHFARVASAIAAAIAVAMLVQLAVNVRIDFQRDVWQLAPTFRRGAGTSVALVLGIVTAFETTRRPLNYLRMTAALGSYAAFWIAVRLLFGVELAASVLPTSLVMLGWIGSRLDSRIARSLMIFGAFATAVYVTHRLLRVNFALTEAAAAGAVMLTVWSSTAAIVRRFDRMFESVMADSR
jgi:hypothetical protein